MLLSALSFACLLVAHVANGQCELSTTKPPRVTEKSNYVIDYFSGSLLFTYAINRCTATSIFGSWYKYSCIQSDGSWSVKKTKYTDAACSKGETVTASYAQGDSMQGELGYFECSGSNNYVEVEVSINPDCSTPQVIAAGLGGCTHNTPLLTEFYCDNTQAFVQLYVDPTAQPSTTEVMDSTTETWINGSSATYDADSSSSTTDDADSSSSTTGDADSSSSTTEYESTTSGLSTTEVDHVMCYDELYCNKWTFVSQCQPVAEILKTMVYGKLDKCSIGETPSTTGNQKSTDGGNDSAAPSLFVITNLVFALAVTLFSLF